MAAMGFSRREFQTSFPAYAVYFVAKLMRFTPLKDIQVTLCGHALELIRVQQNPHVDVHNGLYSIETVCRLLAKRNVKNG